MKSFKSIIENSLPSKERLHDVLFGKNTQTGRFFEQVLMIAIFASIAAVMLESINWYSAHYSKIFYFLEWVFTILFTIEYILRLYCSERPKEYATSFFGVVDLISIIPTYIGAFVPGGHAFLSIRILRLFRIFRLLKLIKFLRAGSVIMSAVKASREKIAIFLIFVVLLVIILGSMMYMIESSADSGFTSIPRSIYWAVVTLTTVGYGDIAPATAFGQFVAAAIMILGYAVIAVPTGIVSAEFSNENKKSSKNREICSRCGKDDHEKEARFCSRCAEALTIVKNVTTA